MSSFFCKILILTSLFSLSKELMGEEFPFTSNFVNNEITSIRSAGNVESSGVYFISIFEGRWPMPSRFSLDVGNSSHESVFRTYGENGLPSDRLGRISAKKHKNNKDLNLYIKAKIKTASSLSKIKGSDHFSSKTGSYKDKINFFVTEINFGDLKFVDVIEGNIYVLIWNEDESLEIVGQYDGFFEASFEKFKSSLPKLEFEK